MLAIVAAVMATLTAASMCAYSLYTEENTIRTTAREKAEIFVKDNNITNATRVVCIPDMKHNTEWTLCVIQHNNFETWLKCPTGDTNADQLCEFL